MKADITRDTFDSGRHFLRVLMQQGRVSLDADWNEQTSILLHHLRTLAADVIGPHGGTEENSFRISLTGGEKLQEELKIAAGRYYVQGLLCENQLLANGEAPSLLTQPNRWYPHDPNKKDELPQKPYLVYLDVWERAITAIEDERIAEVALGGPDTAARTQLIWQVRVLHLDTGLDTAQPGKPIQAFLGEVTHYGKFLAALKLSGVEEQSTGTLRARAKDRNANDAGELCLISPEARYRGMENQLYRVEIHCSGPAWDGQEATRDKAATFVWSRENGSVAFPIERIADSVVTLVHLGRDSGRSLQPGDWVEVVDDDYVLEGLPEPLLKVVSLDPMERTVTLSAAPASYRGRQAARHPLLRRWDQKAPANKDGLMLEDGTVLARATSDPEKWLELEDGIQIQFQPGSQYRAGDYWLIPARVETGDILWPPPGREEAATAHGIRHYYAPLAVIDTAKITSCRYKIKAIAEPLPP